MILELDEDKVFCILLLMLFKIFLISQHIPMIYN